MSIVRSTPTDRQPEDDSIDWSIFESGTVQLYHGAAIQWVIGRAMWRPPPANGSTNVTNGTAISGPQFGTSLDKPLSLPDVSSSLSGHQDEPVVPVAFHIARADDPDSQACLRSEVENMTAMHRGGLSVFLPVATFTDCFGNWISIICHPSQDAPTLREMFITPFAHKNGDAKVSAGTPSNNLQTHNNITDVLTEFLDHAISLVCAVGAMHKYGYIVRCCRTDSWVIGGKDALHTRAVVSLGNATGCIKLESDAEAETSFAQSMFSDRKVAENWMLQTHAQYLAPEVLGRLNIPVDTRADIFSIGVCLYEIVVGHTPTFGCDLLSTIHHILAVEPTPPYDLVPGLPKELSDIIMKCLAKAPHDRYYNTHSLRYDLEEVARGWPSRDIPSTKANLVVGAMDTFSRFRLSNDLLGVDESLSKMRDALTNSQQRDLVTICIQGPSGTGKTTLAHTMSREVEAIGGRLCSGKYDSTSYNRPLAPIWQIINQLSLPLLALSESELDDWRSDIRETIGPSLVHFFESSLDPDLRAYLRLCTGPVRRDSTEDHSSLPPSYSDAFQGAIIRFINMFLKTPDNGGRREYDPKPLVLLIDDVHWASVDDVQFFHRLLAKTVLSGCLLIFTFRDSEGTPAFMGSQLRTMLCELPCALHTRLLSQENIYSEMKNMFKHPDEADDPSLWDFAMLLHNQSLGNAQHFKLLLGNLYQNKLLGFDWSCFAWKWDNVQISNHATTDSALECWEGILAGQSTSEMRKIIFAAASISNGGIFSLRLLAHSMQQPLSTVIKLVETLALETRVFSHTTTGHSRAPLIAASPLSNHRNTPLAGSEPNSPHPEIQLHAQSQSDYWRFAHDILQQAASILIPIDQRAVVHFQIGTSLSNIQDVEHDETILRPLVYNLNESRRLGFRASQEDDLRLIQLNIKVARGSLRSAAGPTALKHLELAKNLVGLNETVLWLVDYETAFSMSEAFFESYTQTAQYQLAANLTETMPLECLKVADKLKVAHWRIKALIHLDPEGAIEFGLRQLAELCKIKIEGSPQAIEMLRQKASFGNATAEDILNTILPETPPEVIARAAVIGSMIAISFVYRPDLAEEISLHAFLDVREGFTEHSALAYSSRTIFLHGRGLHSEANVLSEVCDTLIRKSLSPYSRIEVRLAQVCVAQYSSQTLREIAVTELRIASDAVHLAHWEYLNWTLGYLYFAQLMGGSNELPFRDQEWIAALQGRVTPSALNFTLIGEVLSSILKGDTALPQNAPFIHVPVPIGPNDSLLRVHIAVCESIVSMLFEQPEPQLLDSLLACKGVAPGTMFEAYYPFIMAWLVYGLAAKGNLHNAEANLALAEQGIEKLRSFCNLPNMAHNFVLPYRLAEACRLDHVNKYSEAIVLLEAAIEDAEPNGATLLLGVAYEYAGRLVRKSIGSQRLSRIYLQSAHRTYEDFGAFAKCAHLLGHDPSIEASRTWTPNGTRATTAPASQRKSTAAVTDSVDLATLLSVVSTWQREKSASRVAESLVSVLIQTMGARYGALALMSKENELRLSVAGNLEDLHSDLDIPIQKCGDLIPSSLFNYALRTRKTIIDLASLKEQVGIKEDGFILQHKPRSILVCPIFEEDSLRGVCYLDSARDNAFSKSSFELVGLLSTGAAVAIQRAQLLNELNAQTKGLEDIVRVRTAAAESAAAKAEKASLVQARFLQIMSHEMRTPLNSVVVLSDLLLEASLDPVLYEYVLTIKASSNDLLSVIRDILDFSRLESKNVTLELLPLNVSNLIDDTLDQLAEVAANNDIDLLFATTIGSQTPWLLGDSTRVKQCLSNFLSNALKFTDNNGSVTVTTTYELLTTTSHGNRSTVRVQIAVADTGLGIEPSKLPLLFKKFSQVDNSTTRLFGGSGLGLAIVRELAQLMNGDAWCESVRGKGSTFYCTFEAETCPEPTLMARSPSALKAKMFQGKRAALYGIPKQTASFLASNLGWLGFDVHNQQMIPQEDQLPHFDLIVIALNTLAEPLETVLSRLSTKRGNIRFLTIKTRRQTPTQFNPASKFALEILLTPLRVTELCEALLRLFSSDHGGQNKNNKAATAKKQRVSFPRLAETCPMKILCVDDNAVNIKVLLQLMSRLGYPACDVAHDGEEAVEKCRRTSYDLVLMDLQMPRMDGTTAMVHIRRDQPPPIGPTIIALTASAMSGDRIEALRNGFDDYISKPIIVTSLIECLRRVYAERDHAEITSTSPGVKRSGTEPSSTLKRRHTAPQNNVPC